MRIDIKVMQAFIDTMVGIPKFSYPAKKNAPRPSGEFASVQLIEQYPIGLPVETCKYEINSNGLQTIEGDVAVGAVFAIKAAVRLRFRVTVIGTDGLASVLISNGWTSDVMRQLMITTGYGFIRSMPISLEDALLEKEWEARQGFSIELSTTREYERTLDYITLVSPITGQFNEGNILQQINVNP